MADKNQVPAIHPTGATCIDPDPHAYDDPNISPRDFLRAVMRDQRVPLPLRLNAADKLRRIGPEPAQQTESAPPEPQLTIRIQGFPSLGFMATLAYIKWCHDIGVSPDNEVLYANYLKEHGLGHGDLLSMRVQGHA